MFYPQLLLAIVCVLMCLPVCAAEQINFPAYQNQELPAILETPLAPAVQDWIILLHGSGAHSADADLQVATRQQVSNPFFKHLSAALQKQGFGVMRYDKRNYVISEHYKKDPKSVKHPSVMAFAKAPLTHFLEDARQAVWWLQARYPQARIHVLGHSEGTWTALQLAATTPQVKSVGLIGFWPTHFDTAVFEQSTYRFAPLFTQLDSQKDDHLSRGELAGQAGMAEVLLQQWTTIDLNRDEQISRDEWMASQFSNLLLRDFINQDYRQDEARYPLVAALLPHLKQPITFFVGEYDNQTPAYQTLAAEMANRQVWKKPFRFVYFPKLGHALDPRESYQDLWYQPADPTALDVVAEHLRAQLKAL